MDNDPDRPGSDPHRCALPLRFVGISVAMYEFPLAILTAIDLGHEIERYGLILTACVCLRALEADPVRDTDGGSRVDRLESILTAAGEQGCVPSKQP
jgi:hypothetical protein